MDDRRFSQKWPCFAKCIVPFLFVHRDIIDPHTTYSAVFACPLIARPCFLFFSVVMALRLHPHDVVYPARRLQFSTACFFPHWHRHSLANRPLAFLTSPTSTVSIPNTAPTGIGGFFIILPLVMVSVIRATGTEPACRSFG